MSTTQRPADRMAAVGSVRAQQGGPGPQALRQPARGRREDGDADGARRLHAPPGRLQRLGGALRPDRGQRPGRQGHVLRSGGRQGLPPPDLLRAARSRSTTCEGTTRCKHPSNSTAAPPCSTCCASATPAWSSRQRLGEWCGHAPVLEEDIALANIALDLVGQARALLTHAGAARGPRPRRGPARLPARRARLLQPARWSSCRAATSPSPCCATRWSPPGSSCCGSGWPTSSDARAGRHRRQGGEGGALPPAARRRLGRAPGRRHRRIARAHARRRSAQLWPLLRRAVRRRRGRRRGRAPAAWARAGRELQRRLARRDAARCSTRPRSQLPAEHAPSAAPASAACTASTWAILLAEMQHLQRAYPGGVW